MSRILSVCTGYAGLDLAVEAVTGARTVAVSDLDKGANKILAHRFPDIPNLGDLKNIDWAAWAGVEYMTAGYPCQPFSHAGKRNGTDDPRHIFPYIADGIRIVGPRVVVLENVRGHLALGFDTVLGTLADIGYDARWVCVRASDVGAPHRRERLFIVATPNADSSGLQERRDQAGVHQAQRGQGSAVDGSGRSFPSPNADSVGHERARSARGWWEGSADNREPAADAVRQRLRQHAGRSPSEEAGARGCDLSGNHHGERPDTDWGPYGAAVNRWAATLGRPAPAPTEPGAKGQPRLSPRFVEFMMGLPAGWVTDVPDLTRNEQLKALGNGVVPQQASSALTFLLNRSEVAA